MLTWPATFATGFCLAPLAACCSSSSRAPWLLPVQPEKTLAATSETTTNVSG